MDLSGLLGSIDARKINDIVKVLSENQDLIKQMAALPDLFDKIGGALTKAGEQAGMAGAAMLGSGAEKGITSSLDDGATSLDQIAAAIGSGVDKLGDVAGAIKKLSILDAPATALADAANQIGSTTDQLASLSASMTQMSGVLAVVGEALHELGAHLTESGDDVRGFLAANGR